MRHKSIPPLSPRNVERFWSKVDRSGGPDACWPWLGSRTRSGYGSFVANDKFYRSHRVAYSLATGNDPGDRQVCHNCPGGDNPSCCNDRHLWLGTNAENVADAYAKGMTPRPIGERNPSARLGENDVREIRRRCLSGERAQAVANDYGVCLATVDNIRSRRSWRHVL